MAKRAWMTLAVTAAQVAALAPLAGHLALDTAGTFWAALAYFALFGFGLSAIESRFFFHESPIRARHWLGGAALSAGIAGIATALFASPEGVTGADAIASWFDERGQIAWLHVGYTATTFMVAYCVIGSATWPFVKEYYEDPASKLKLRVPSARVIIPLQLGRGLLSTIALLPLTAGLDPTANGPAMWAALALSLSMTSAIVPMIWASDWPTRLRVAHGIEITIFSIVQAGAWWWWLIR